MSESVIVEPLSLEMHESAEPVHDSFKIINQSDSKICFRVRVSVQHIFVVPNSENFLEPNSETDIQVTMKPLSHFPNIDTSRVKV